MIDKVTGEIIAPFVRSPFNYDLNEASDRSGLKCEDPSRADQSFAEQSDINTIVKQFGLTGQLPEGVTPPQSGDFTEVYDYHSAMNVVRQAQESFMEMPADIRAEFNNDPGRFMAFVHDPANRERAEKMGLVVKREAPKPPEPVLVKVIPEPAPPGGTSST